MADNLIAAFFFEKCKQFVRSFFVKIWSERARHSVDLKTLWDESLTRLSDELQSLNFDMWIKPIVPLSLEKGVLSLGVGNTFALKMLSDRLSTTVSRVVNEISVETLEVAFSVKGQQKRHSEDKQKAPAKKLYTFESFIVGPSNELAFAASKQLADFKDSEFNPLYIYSNVGLGKTHLLQSILVSLQDHKIKAKYVTSERFTNEYIKAIKENKTENFREKYRNVDALLVDDIQFLSGKTQTQEGFFHTYNELFLANKKIILAGDDPSKLSEIESRLTSRLQAGLVVDIQPPDYETKVAIIEDKCKRLSFSMTQDIVDHIAQICNVNIRQIESLVNRLKAITQLKQEVLDLETAKTMIVGFDQIKIKIRPGPEEVISAVADYFAVSEDEIRSNSRSSQITKARRLSSYILRKDLHLTASASGSIIGNKNHVTVLNAVKFIEAGLLSDNKLRLHLQQIRNTLNIA